MLQLLVAMLFPAEQAVMEPMAQVMGVGQMGTPDPQGQQELDQVEVVVLQELGEREIPTEVKPRMAVMVEQV